MLEQKCNLGKDKTRQAEEKNHLEKKLSAGVEEAKKHRGLNILLLQTFCTSCVRFYCR